MNDQGALLETASKLSPVPAAVAEEREVVHVLARRHRGDALEREVHRRDLLKHLRLRGEGRGVWSVTELGALHRIKEKGEEPVSTGENRQYVCLLLQTAGSSLSGTPESCPTARRRLSRECAFALPSSLQLEARSNRTRPTTSFFLRQLPRTLVQAACNVFWIPCLVRVLGSLQVPSIQWVRHYAASPLPSPIRIRIRAEASDIPLVTPAQATPQNAVWCCSSSPCEAVHGPYPSPITPSRPGPRTNP